MTPEALSSAILSAIRSLADLVWWDGFVRGLALGVPAGLALAAMAAVAVVGLVHAVLWLRG